MWGGDISKWSNCTGEENINGRHQYKGEFLNGQRHGFGVMDVLHPDFKGDKYVGEFKDGIQSGQGTYTFASGNKYIGEFKDGFRNGQGILYSVNGSIKESGIYKDDKLVTSQYIDPNSFTRIAHGITVPIVSESQSNLPACKGGDMHSWNNCFGTSNYASGNKFVGEFKNGQHNGQGTFTYANGNKYSGEHKDGKFFGQGIFTFTNGIVQIGEWKDEKPHGRFIEYSAGKIVVRSGLFEDGKLITSQYIDPNSFTRISRSSIPLVVSDTQRFDSEQSNLQLEQERRLLSEERRKFDEEKRQREQAKTNQRVNLQVNNTHPTADGDVTITVQTNADTASLKINGEEQGGRPDGNYTLKRVARAGQETRFEIYAKDVYGNTDTKTISVSRTVVESKVTYQQLNPDRIKRQPERDAVAIIIGISNYKSLPKADYAKDDAQVFFDYAIRALGVRPGNIKLLMDEQADAEEIYTAFKTWLPARVKSATDVYVFYSGHGLPTQDGSGLYWLPQRANRDVISKTAILLQDISSDIQAAKPKSVTIFMDACYSGQARGGETLVASARPIALKSQPTSFPSNFTIISASQADQISSSSPELQHGIFSYYLMRGMEGEADLNKDGKITLDEIQAYLSEKVGRQARIMNRQQEPQVIGDGSRVLVGR